MGADVLGPALGALGVQHIAPGVLRPAVLRDSWRRRGDLGGWQAHCSRVAGPIHHLSALSAYSIHGQGFLPAARLLTLYQCPLDNHSIIVVHGSFSEDCRHAEQGVQSSAARRLTKSARYVRSLDDWMEFLLLKLNSC